MSTTYKDYYKILGVPRTATEKEIKAAFRKLARKHHPDVNRDDAAAEARFKEVNEANAVLSDPEKRRRYDEVGPGTNPFAGGQPAPGRYGFRPGGGGPQVRYQTVRGDDLEGFEGGDFSEFFQSIFGGAAGVPRSRVARRGTDVEGEAAVTIEEVYNGTSRTVEISTSSGPRRVSVDIPKGIGDGARVRAAGQGEEGMAGGPSGDLYIRVRVLPHPRFTREGADLKVRVPVPLDVALLGGDINVPTPKGRAVNLKVPRETQNGRVLRLRGQGLPRLREGGHGDLLAEVDVRLPTSLDPETRALAEALRKAPPPPAE